MGPPANNGIQSSVSLFVILGHIKKGRESNVARERERDSSSSRFSGLCRSVSVAEWTVPVFVPVPVSRCQPEARRHCFRMERRRSGLLPLSLSLPTSLPSRGRGAGREQEARLHTVLVTPTCIGDTLGQQAAGNTHTHTHVHLLLFSRGIPGFLVNTAQVNRLPVWHTEIRGGRLYVLNSSLLNSNVLWFGQLLNIWCCSLADFLIYSTSYEVQIDTEQR